MTGKSLCLASLYVASIAAANLSASYFGPWVTPLNSFLFIGLDLSIRDRLHDDWMGKNFILKMGGLILAGGVVAYLVSPSTAKIAVASCVSFLLSGVVDAVVYHAMRGRRWHIRSNCSNVAGAAVDSFVFPSVAFGAILPEIIVLQFAAKTIGGFCWSFLLRPKQREHCPG